MVSIQKTLIQKTDQRALIHFADWIVHLVLRRMPRVTVSRGGWARGVTAIPGGMVYHAFSWYRYPLRDDQRCLKIYYGLHHLNTRTRTRTAWTFYFHSFTLSVSVV